MDEAVLPPVQQDVKPYWYSTPLNYDLEPIDDYLWMEDDEGVVEEMKLEMPDYTTFPREEEVCEPLDKMEDEKKEHVSDLAYLETLLEEKPTMEFKQIPNAEEEKVAKKFDSWPIKELGIGLLLTPTRTREKARMSLDQHILRFRRRCKRKRKANLKYKVNHLHHYIYYINFVSDKFKF
ncbi:hypothetical protein Hanom_Chr12g01174451 [Helianthus anomalus]